MRQRGRLLPCSLLRRRKTGSQTLIGKLRNERRSFFTIDDSRLKDRTGLQFQYFFDMPEAFIVF